MCWVAAARRPLRRNIRTSSTVHVLQHIDISISVSVERRTAVMLWPRGMERGLGNGIESMPTEIDGE